MIKRQEMTDEELDAILEEIWGPLPPRPKPKPKVVLSEGKEVRDATVQVSPSDPNYRKADEGVVRVRRPGFVTINMAAWEEDNETFTKGPSKKRGNTKKTKGTKKAGKVKKKTR